VRSRRTIPSKRSALPPPPPPRPRSRSRSSGDAASAARSRRAAAAAAAAAADDGDDDDDPPAARSGVAFSALVGRDGGRYVADIVVGPPPPRQDGRDSRAAADASATSAEMTIRGEDFIVV
jgi:hypothetical protein